MLRETADSGITVPKDTHAPNPLLTLGRNPYPWLVSERPRAVPVAHATNSETVAQHPEAIWARRELPKRVLTVTRA